MSAMPVEIGRASAQSVEAGSNRGCAPRFQVGNVVDATIDDRNANAGAIEIEVPGGLGVNRSGSVVELGANLTIGRDVFDVLVLGQLGDTRCRQRDMQRPNNGKVGFDRPLASGYPAAM